MKVQCPWCPRKIAPELKRTHLRRLHAAKFKELGEPTFVVVGSKKRKRKSEGAMFEPRGLGREYD